MYGAMSRLLADESRKFIFTFCDPQQVVDDFSGQLGKFTPCFVDIIILGKSVAMSDTHQFMTSECSASEHINLQATVTCTVSCPACGPQRNSKAGFNFGVKVSVCSSGIEACL